MRALFEDADHNRFLRDIDPSLDEVHIPIVEPIRMTPTETVPSVGHLRRVRYLRQIAGNLRETYLVIFRASGEKS